MTDAGFFKGTSTEQDARFSDKKKKLMKTMKFGENLSQKVDMTRVNLECIKPWIVRRITELLNFEDEVVWDYVMNQLDERYPDPKEIQINITGFLNSKNARIFLSELWDLLLSAMQNPDGVPAALIEAKKTEIASRQMDEKKVQMEIRRKQEELRVKAANSQISSNTNAVSQKSALLPCSVSNGANHEASNVVVNTTASVDVKPSSVSTSPARRLDSENGKAQCSLTDERKHHRKDRRRHRSRSTSTSSYSSVEGGSRGRRRSRHRHRSRSAEPATKKPAVPESDWRKDLMAGRRRSPPAMPENSYYGYEKHRRDHKHARHRHRSSDSDDDYHRSRQTRRRGESPLRRPRDDTPRDYRHHDRRSSKYREHSESPEGLSRHYREKRRRRESPSPSPISPRAASHVYSDSADRANRFHDRRAQWAQEEDELKSHAFRESSGKRKQNTVSRAERQSERFGEFAPSRTPEGPDLPVALKESNNVVTQRQVQKLQSPLSSSDSESESSSSSDESSSSSSSSSCESVDDNDDTQVPEGPSLPPSTRKAVPEPEGPTLPPNVVAVVASSSKPIVPQIGNNSSSSEGSGSESNSDDSGSSSESESGSSSSGSKESSDSSSDSGGDDGAVNRGPSPPKRRKTGENIKSSRSEQNHRDRLPEGPALPSDYTSQSSVQYKNYADGSTRSSEKRRKDIREESAEEALRRRALASLLQASGKRHRHGSRPS